MSFPYGPRSAQCQHPSHPPTPTCAHTHTLLLWNACWGVAKWEARCLGKALFGVGKGPLALYSSLEAPGMGVGVGTGRCMGVVAQEEWGAPLPTGPFIVGSLCRLGCPTGLV